MRRKKTNYVSKFRKVGNKISGTAKKNNLRRMF